MKELSRLFSVARAHRGQAWRAAFFSVLNKLFDIAPEVLIGVAVDIVVRRENSFLAQLGIPEPETQMWAIGGLTLFIWVGESICEYIYLLGWRNLAQIMQHEFRIKAYAHVQSLDMAYFEDQSTGGLMAVLNDDINQMERFLNGGISELIQVVTSVIVIGGIFLYLSPTLAVLAMLPIPVILAGAFFFQAKMGARYAAVREHAGLLNARLANNLSGIATIKSYTAEIHEVAAIANRSQAYMEANRRAIAVSSAFIPVIRMAILSGFLVTLIYGGHLSFRGQLAVGSFSALVFLTQRLLWPLTRLAETFDLYQRAMASIQRVLNLLAIPIGTTSGSVQQIGAHAVAFQDVSFGYAGRKALFDRLSFAVPQGHMLGIVGATGAGKSTIAKLLLRFYQPTAGAITLGEQPLERLDLSTLRRAIGFVSQDVFLVDGTVRENIEYGTFQAPSDAIIEAARIAEAHDFIMTLSQGYETLVGERGQKLSGGQKQRLAIARAVLKNPPVLVFDEATSAVDNETEAAIQRSLNRLMQGRTSFVIAHRLSTVRHAHKIIVLDGGKIAEEGTHDELIARRGLYWNLWTVQTGGI